MSSQKTKKEEYIHMRISAELKENLKKKAEGKNQSLTEYILEHVEKKGNVMTEPNVMTETNVMTEKYSEEIKTLVEGIRELNEFMRYNKDRLQAPDNIDGIKITKAVRLSWEITI